VYLKVCVRGDDGGMTSETLAATGASPAQGRQARRRELALFPDPCQRRRNLALNVVTQRASLFSKATGAL